MVGLVLSTGRYLFGVFVLVILGNTWKDGRESKYCCNYSLEWSNGGLNWRTQLRLALLRDGLWGIVQGTEEEPVRTEANAAEIASSLGTETRRWLQYVFL